MKKAIFLDKDGTLIPDIPYNIDPEKITLSANCIEGLKLLANEGYQLIIVSNQSGIARGYFTEQQLAEVIRRLHDLLSRYQVFLTDFYYCPHHPQGDDLFYGVDCKCRKPMPGMLEQAAKDHKLDLAQCWMIGDILNDVEAGNRAGCKTIILDNGNETEWVSGEYRTPTHSCKTIDQAAIFIYNHIISDARLERR